MPTEAIVRVTNTGPRMRVSTEGSPTLRVQMQQPRVRVSNVGLRGAKGDPDDSLKGIVFAIQGGGAPIEVGQRFECPAVPFDCDIERWTMTGDQSGAAVVDVLRSDFAGYPGDLASIAGTELPTLAAAEKALDDDLDTWTVALNEGDMLRAVVTETDLTLEVLTLTLWVRRRA